jgi:TolA-binding protein
LNPLRPEAALAAALLVAGCAAAGGGARPAPAEAEALRDELAAARAENQRLTRQVEALTARVEALAARPAREKGAPRPAAPAPAAASAAPAASPVIPEGLAVVRVEPAAEPEPEPVSVRRVVHAGATPAAPAAPRVKGRRAPAVATDVAIVEPAPGALDGLAPRGGRGLSAEAEAEWRAARKLGGVARAHAMEDFALRYPHHPQADDALVDASGAYADAGRPDAGCAVARRAAEEYPAGDAAPEALWRLAACEPRGGDAERRLLTRLVSEFPTTAAAHRAGARLAVITGRPDVASPSADPARSGP